VILFAELVNEVELVNWRVGLRRERRRHTGRLLNNYCTRRENRRKAYPR
jgi:hypothetical protein